MEDANFGDMASHDQEIRAVDVDLHALEDGLDDVSLGLMPFKRYLEIWECDLARS